MTDQPTRTLRRDATQNYHRVLEAAREVFGESGAEASIEDIAARAGVGIGTVYRRFASKEALIDELLRLALADIIEAGDRALAQTGNGGRPEGQGGGEEHDGLEEFLRAITRPFADHARYADLLLQRQADPAATARIRAAIAELTERAVAAGTVNPQITLGDVMALIWSLRGLAQSTVEVAPDAWQRYLDIHLAGMRASGPLSQSPAMSARQLARLTAQPG
jgi:AcrR family transcriptional regulator